MASTSEDTCQGQLEQCTRLLRDCALLPQTETSVASTSAHASSNDIISSLIAVTDDSSQGLEPAQVDAWARCISVLTEVPVLAEQALQQGALHALLRFIKRYKSNPPEPPALGPPVAAKAVGKDEAWAAVLTALHNLAVEELKDHFREALSKLQREDLDALAVNLALALRPGMVPQEARDATLRLATYSAMMAPLIEKGVLVSLCSFIPYVKPLNRLLPAQWNKEVMREINNTIGCMDHLLLAYNELDRNEELPIKDLANSQLTGWICDVLHGASATDSDLKQEIETSRVSALECLTSLLLQVPVCRAAVPGNRSMLFRVASAITGNSSMALLSAAAQVLAQALSEDDLVPPSELASLHTYDLVRHMSQVLDTSRNYNDLLNVLAALQNILDPSHFKGSVGPMKKVAERLTACAFEDTIFSFVHGIKKRYNEILAEGGDSAPGDFDTLDDTARGVLENTRSLLRAVGPVGSPRAGGRTSTLASSGATGQGDTGRRGGRGGRSGGRGRGSSADLGPGGGGRGKRKSTGDAADEGGKRRRGADKANGSTSRGGSAGPSGPRGGFTSHAERMQLEKEMRRAAVLVAPLLVSSALKSVLDWFNEWGISQERLEDELGTDVHLEEGIHRLLLLEALEEEDAETCLDMLQILQVRLPPLKG